MRKRRWFRKTSSRPLPDKKKAGRKGPAKFRENGAQEKGTGENPEGMASPSNKAVER